MRYLDFFTIGGHVDISQAKALHPITR